MNNLLYTYNIDTTEDMMERLAKNLRKRRLEKKISREALSKLSNIPTATIAKFEQKFTISLSSFVALAKALGYTQELKQLLSEPLFSSMAELDMINQNQNRKRGSSK